MPTEFSSALDWLYSTQMFGIKLGLESMQRLVSALQLPEQKIIHVAGTNGKGSTCSLMASIAQTGGVKVGLFTSPHLISFCERIQVNGQLIPETDVARLIQFLRQLVADWDPHPTFFELTTALALAYFAEQKTELIVLETGMGGRLDATNVVTPVVSVITPIDLDHQQWLGQTIREIAGEKAGIIKPGIPTVSAPQRPEAEAVLRATGPVEFIHDLYTDSPISLPGRHQQGNATLAIAALRAAGFHFSPDIIASGLATTIWPARFQKVTPQLVIDGAHNPAGAAVLAETWKTEFPNTKAHLIFGAVAAKDIRSVLETLLPLAASMHCITLKSPRAMDAREIQQLAAALSPALPITCPESLAQAIRQAPRPTLITGSLYLCGEALAEMQGGRAFEVSAQ